MTTCLCMMETPTKARSLPALVATLCHNLLKQNLARYYDMATNIVVVLFTVSLVYCISYFDLLVSDAASSL